jgi:hypothetical protein
MENEDGILPKIETPVNSTVNHALKSCDGRRPHVPCAVIQTTCVIPKLSITSDV